MVQVLGVEALERCLWCLAYRMPHQALGCIHEVARQMRRAVEQCLSCLAYQTPNLQSGMSFPLDAWPTLPAIRHAAAGPVRGLFAHDLRSRCVLSPKALAKGRGIPFS